MIPTPAEEDAQKPAFDELARLLAEIDRLPPLLGERFFIRLDLSAHTDPVTQAKHRDIDIWMIYGSLAGATSQAHDLAYFESDSIFERGMGGSDRKRLRILYDGNTPLKLGYHTGQGFESYCYEEADAMDDIILDRRPHDGFADFLPRILDWAAASASVRYADLAAILTPAIDRNARAAADLKKQARQAATMKPVKPARRANIRKRGP